jgi:mxaJ protein
MGVRKGDEKLLQELDAALEKAKPQIHAILEEEGIPLLEPTPTNVTPKS